MKLLDGLDLNGQKITNAADGSSASDVATYGQVLNMVNGLAFHPAVKAASTANVSVASPGATMDGYTFGAGDRLLLKNQTTGSENGLWIWNGATSALTRPSDYVTGEVSQGATVVVVSGTTNADTQWTLNTSGTITVGTTSTTWAESGAAGLVYTQGNGINITGTTISAVVVSGGGLSNGSSGLQIDRAKVGFIYAANVGNGSSTSIAVTHNLGTQDVVVSLQDAATHGFVMTDWVATDANTVTLTFATAPASNAYRVTIHG